MKTDSAVATRWRQLRLGLAWDSTILAPPLAALTIIDSDRFPNGRANPTAGIDDRGRMYINPTWASQQNDGQARFVILHEVLHLILRHHERVGGRDRDLWNLSGDLVINDCIQALGLRSDIERPQEGIFREKHAPHIPPNLSVEEVYELLRSDGQGGQGKITIKITVGQVTGGCGVEPAEGQGDGSGEGGDGQGDGQGISVEITGDMSGLSPQEWQNIAQAVANAAKSASTSGGAALTPLLRIPPSRVRWDALLRELAAAAVSRAGRDNVSYSRRSRRSPRRIFLPGTVANDVRLAIIIDSSGSMSDDELAACVAETRAAIDAAGVKAFLVVHDHEVRAETWIAPGSGTATVTKQITGRGGTLFQPAYDAVAEAGASFAAVVHFTDGYPGDAWPARPVNCQRAVCALTSDGRSATVPGGWRVVPIQMPGRL